VGFVITQVHFSKYELPEYELLRARYLAAGTTFLIFLLGPYLAAMLSLSVAARDIPDTKNLGVSALWDAKKRVLPRVFAIWALFIFLVPPAYARPYPYGFFWAGVHFIPMYILALVFMQPFYMWQKTTGTQDGPAHGTVTSGVLLVSWILAFLLTVALHFGQFTYPHISPALGGGAVWVGTVQQKEGEGSRSVSVLITSQNRDQVRYLSCSWGGNSWSLKPHVTKWDMISALRLDSLAILKEVKETRFCGQARGAAAAP
jgi:hypothetical protein